MNEIDNTQWQQSQQKIRAVRSSIEVKVQMIQDNLTHSGESARLSIPQWGSKSKIGIVLGLLVSALLLLSALVPASTFAQQATVPNTEIVLSVDYDGTVPFGADAAFAGNTDGQHTPGLDDNANNNVVRTFDFVQYRIDWNVNEVNATNVVISAALPSAISEVVWVELPSVCLTTGITPPSSISADGQVLTCNLGDMQQGTSGTFYPQAEVAGTHMTIDGDVITLQATIETDQSAAVASNTVDTTISAAPKFDWEKGHPKVYRNITNTVSSQVGRVLVYPLVIRPEGDNRGMAPLDDSSSIQFFDHLYYWSNGSASTITGTLVTAGNAAQFTGNFGGRVCGGYDGDGSEQRRDVVTNSADNMWVPYGVNGLGNATNTTTGAWNNTELILCTDVTGANSYPIVRFDITGQDSRTIPAKAANGNLNGGIAIAAQVAFFIAEDDLFPGGTGNGYLHNAITGNAQPVAPPVSPYAEPSAIADSITVTATTGAAEPTTLNNAVATQIVATLNEAGDKTYRHWIIMHKGPYQQAQVIDPFTGLPGAGIDERITQYRGGLGRNGVHDTAAGALQWNFLGEVARDQLVTIELGLTTTNSGVDYASAYREPVHGCAYIDTTYMELIDFPSTFDVYDIERWVEYGNTLGSSQGTPTHSIAHVLYGDTGFNWTNIFGRVNGVRLNPTFQPNYILEVAKAVTPPGTAYNRGDVQCNDAQADQTHGWVAVTGATDLSIFDPNGDGRYEDIHMVRLRTLEAVPWRSAFSAVRDLTNNQSGGDVQGTSILAYLQAQVKPTISDAPDGSQIYIHAARARGEWDGVDAPSTAECIRRGQASFTSFNDNPTGWCNLATTPPAAIANSSDPVEETHNSNGTIEAAHRDTIVVGGPKLTFKKENVDGLADVVTNGELVKFRFTLSVAGGPTNADIINNITLSDPIPSNFEFVSLEQPSTAGSTCSASPNIWCTFGNRYADWTDTFTVTMRVKDAVANQVLANTAVVRGTRPNGDSLRLDGFAYAYMPGPYSQLEIRKDVPDLLGPCIHPPGSTMLSTDDCSLIDIDGQMSFTLTLTNTGNVDLNNIDVVDVLPHLDDEVEAQTTFAGTPASVGDLGDGRTPESDFSGTIELVSVVGGNSVTYYDAPYASINRDPTQNGALATTAVPADAEGFVVGINTLAAGSTKTIVVTLDTNGNIADDIYTNSFGAWALDDSSAYAAGIRVPNRSNDVSTMPLDVTVGSTVWYDADDDGVQDPGELGIVGVVVALLDDQGAPFINQVTGQPYTTVTDANGDYFFDNLPQGAYQVAVTPPASTPLSSTPTDSADNGVDGNDNGDQPGGSGTIITSPVFTLTLGAETTAISETFQGGTQDTLNDNIDANGDMTIDFGLIGPGRIGDTIWHDLNGDGVEDVGEMGIPTVTVTLEDSFGNILTTTTDSNGNYIFENLPLDTYTITVDTSDLPMDKLTIPTGDPDSTLDSTSTTTLTAGDPEDLEQDFGYQPFGSLGNTIFHDANNDGIFDPADGDFAMPGVDVILTYPDGMTETVSTDTNGMYLFDELPLNQTYTVTVDTDTISGKDDGITGDPSLTADQTSEGSTSLTTTLTADDPNTPENEANDPTLDFGFTSLGSLGNTIFHDANNDGIFDPADGDFAMPGVDVILTYPDGMTETVSTDTNGMYLFDELPLNQTYTVTVDTDTISGKDDGITGDPSLTADQTSEGSTSLTTTLTADDPNTPEDEANDPTLDFGFTSLGSLGNTIFHDANNDGIFDLADGDFAMPGVDVILTYPDGMTETVSTDTNGMYLFDELPLNQTYTVTVDTDTISGKDDGITGDPSLTADQTSEGSTSLTTTLTADDPNTPEDEANDPTLDFGFTSLGSLGNTIFHDANNDGIFDPADGDFAMPGVDVILTYPDGMTETVSTDTNGMYLFDELPLNQTYTVTVDTDTISGKDDGITGDPSLTADQTSEGSTSLTTTLTADDPNTPEDEANDPTLDFGFTSLGSLGNTIFHDANNDGIFDLADGDFAMPGVDVILTYPDGMTETVSTDTNGMYLFDELPLNQTYTVTVDTDTISGKDDGITGDPSLTADQTSEGSTSLTTTLTADDPNTPEDEANDPTLDFGFTSLGSLGNTIFHDANNDGIFDLADGDFAMPGVDVILTYPDGMTETVSTDTNGMYLFDELPLNQTYTVTVDTSTISGKDDGITGDPSLTADQTSEGSTSLTTTLTADDPNTPEDEANDPTLDFGFTSLGSLGNTIFHDANNDGIFDPADGDFAMPGVDVILTYPDGMTETVSTDTNGMYLFDELPLNQTYTVTVDTSTISGKDDGITGDPSLTADQTSEGSTSLTTTLTADDPNTPEDEANDPTLDFGFTSLGSLGNTIFHDANNDGIFDPADGDFAMPGVDVILTYPDGMTETVSTDTNGMYLFDELPLNQTYTVTVDTSTISGKDDGITGDPSLTADQTSEGSTSLTTTLTADDPNTPEDEANDPTLDFGFTSLGSLGNTIFHDIDGDGAYDPAAGDYALENVDVTLIYPDGTTETIPTDGNGYYEFTDLPLNQTYTVMVDTSTIPGDKLSTPTGDSTLTDDQTSEGTSTLMTTLTPENPDDPLLDFGFQPYGSIGDTIWHDENGDGIQNPGEAGIPGVTVTLIDSNGMTQTATTDGFGMYLFGDLPLGDYTVLVDTTDLPSDKLTTPSGDPDGGADSTSQVTIAVDDPNTPEDEANNRDQDFGYEPVGSIGDTIFHDANGDGVMNTTDGDFPLDGVTVLLTDANGNLVGTAVTDANGNYLFEDLPLGDYVVTVDTSTLPATKLTTPSGDPDGGPGGIGDSTSAVSLTPENPDDRDQDFGYEPEPDAPIVGAIGDIIFHDADGDGVYEPNDGDFPLENVAVTLTDANGDQQTTTTDENGFYIFTELPLGDYTVTVDPATLPDGKVLNPSADPDGGSDNTSMTTLTEEDPVDLEQDFGYEPEPLGSIGDNIFHDRNGDGVYDPNDGDFPLDGVPVTLTDSNGMTWTTTTDAAGNYLFEDLPLDETYTVVVDTSGLVNKESAPSADPDGGADSTSMVTLTADDPNTPGDEANNRDQDFGYEPTPDAPTLGAIGDTIFHDANGDGVMNTADGDFPLENVSVTLTDANGNMQTMMTDENGQYLFGSLPMGDYTVTVDPATLPDGKTLNPSADPDGGSDNTSDVTLTEEAPVDLDQDFGYEPEPLGSIGDNIFHDRNGDGVYDPNDGDFPLEGITVTLTDENGNTQSTTTNASGEYLFTDLPLDAMYTVMVDTSGLVNKENAPSADPDGGADSVSVVNLTQDAPDNRDQDFGYEPTPDAPTLGAIGDTIFHDANGDGVYDPNAGDFPLPGVTVTLTGPNGSQTAVTDENGMYLFGNLPLGDYTVTVDTATVPDGKLLTPSADPDGGADSTSNVRLTEDNPVDLDQDFGYEPLSGTIGDQIWHDNDNDGNNIIDGDDEPIAGVTVNLLDSSGTIIATAVTDANGFYEFTGLPLNETYTVQVDTTTLSAEKQNNLAYDPDGGDDNQSTVTLTSDNPDNREQDFAYYTQPQFGSIGDTIFHDEDSDGLYEPSDGDRPLEGVEVSLTDSSGTVITTTTDANGNYLFENLPFGDYTVTVDTTTLPSDKLTTPTADPDGGADSISNVTLTPPQPDNMDQDFGYERDPSLASLGNWFWVDSNNDGVKDSDEPAVIGGVVNLFDEAGVLVATTTTDPDGFFEFVVPAGDYRLEFIPPDGYVFTEENASGNINSDVNRSTGFTSVISLEEGENDPNWSAGVVQVPTAITLTDFNVTVVTDDAGTKLIVSWTTSAELDTYGFHVLRSNDSTFDSAIRVTDRIIESQGSAGGSYSISIPYDAATDPPIWALSFWLYEMEISDSVNYYGPVVADVDASQMDTFMFLPFLSQ